VQGTVTRVPVPVPVPGIHIILIVERTEAIHQGTPVDQLLVGQHAKHTGQTELVNNDHLKKEADEEAVEVSEAKYLEHITTGEQSSQLRASRPY
jgi:hypothetical protein